MKKFDTRVQYLKYSVLREVAREAWNNTLSIGVLDIPKRLIPGNTPTMRCCVYKERAILGERIKIAMGGHRSDRNVMEVIDIACDECPISGFQVNDTCRGCLAHACEDACHQNAITFDVRQRRAFIDPSSCVNCGACAKECPYGAITRKTRPCENACKVKAISASGENQAAHIDFERCTDCGACMHQCPFGAIADKSYLLNVIDILKRKHEGAGYKTYAIVAPSISTQFSYARGEQVIAGLKRLGFDAVVEAALGADMVAVAEAQELAQKGTLVSSCCPAFVEYIQQHFPHLTGYISETPSPMAMTGRYIKEQDPTAKTVFIGPCTAKKAEGRRPDVLPFVDSVMTFEELRALFDAREVDITTLEDVPLQDASPWGRRLGKTGGLAGAVKAAWRELNLGEEEPKCASCDGLEQCRIMLLKLGKGVHNVDFIEGMACVGGCIAGAGCQSRAKTGAALLDEHAAASSKTSVTADLPPIPKH